MDLYPLGEWSWLFAASFGVFAGVGEYLVRVVGSLLQALEYLWFLLLKKQLIVVLML